VRVLVTGGAGFIGSHVVRALLRGGHAVEAVDNLSTGKRENLPAEAALHVADIGDRAALAEAFARARPEAVVHLAAQASVKVSMDDPARDVQANVMGGLEVLEAARRTGARRLLFASSGGAVYGEVPEGRRAEEGWPARPKSVYAASKGAFELYLEVYRQEFGISSAALRFANVYGPRQDPHGEAGVVAIFARRLLAGEEVTIFARRRAGDDGCVRDYVYVEDVASACALALERGLEGTYNVGTGEGRTTREVLEALARAAGVEARVALGPPRVGDLEVSCLDPARLVQAGWRPATAFADGIARTVEWFRGRP
jgi:UDP-glucose 4-epimerase